MKTILLALLALASTASAGATAEESGAPNIAAQCDALHAAYAESLRELASWCDANALESQSEFTRAWLPRRDSLMLYVFALPQSSAAPPKLVQSDAGRQWWDRFTKLRREQAEKLFQLAQSAAKAGQSTLAMEFVREAVRENPDHQQGRAFLGFERYEDRWVTSESARRLRAGQVWSDKFGWLPADHLPRYERGMRYYRGRWIDAAEDARLHSNIRSGWRVETDHFAVTTNHSLEEGVRLAQQLETLYDVWRQAFVEFYAPPADLQRWFSAGSAPRSGAARKLYQVVYFRDKQQYVASLRTAQPQIAISLGTYLDDAKTAYFFAGEQQYDGTLYHEATHQLFRETRPGAVDPGRKNNFWIVEAVACYMESLAEHKLLPDENYGMYYTLGGVNEGRVPAARKRLLDDNFYVPLRELVPLGMLDLQHDPRLRQIYSQSAGLALFLVSGEAGRYRPALMDYLIAVYTGRADLGTLEKLAGVKYEDLDRRYREFMK